MENVKIKTAVILAGGEGIRLRPITYHKPKPMVEVLGYPVLGWNIELARRYGVEEIFLLIATEYSMEVKDYFCPGTFGTNTDIYNGMILNFRIEQERLGTGGGLRLLKDLIKEDTFIMMNGDEVKDVKFDLLYNSFKRNSATLGIAATWVDDTSPYGSLEIYHTGLLRAGKIISFKEKRADRIPGLINSGAYILNKEIFNYLPDQEVISMEKEVFPKVVTEDKAVAEKCITQWYPIDTIGRYAEACHGWRGFDNG